MAKTHCPESALDSGAFAHFADEASAAIDAFNPDALHSSWKGDACFVELGPRDFIWMAAYQVAAVAFSRRFL